MRHIFYIGTLVLSSILVGNSTGSLAQGSTNGPIPNYIFAYNAQSVVYLTSIVAATKKVKPRKVDGEKEYHLDDFSSLDDPLWNELVRVVTEGLTKANLRPGPVIQMDLIKVQQDPNFLKDQAEKKLKGIKPYYSITVTFMDKERLPKQFKSKGRLTAKDIRQVSLAISPVDAGTDMSKMYFIMKMNASFAEVLDQLKKDVEAKPSSYFLKEVDEADIEKKQEAMAEMHTKYAPLMELDSLGKGYNSFPDDLTKDAVLVVHRYSNDTGMKSKDAHANKWIDWSDTWMKKFYGGSYKLVSHLEYSDAVKKANYKYVLVPIQEKVVIEYTDDLGIKSTRLTAVYHYVVKNIETRESYYGPVIESNFKGYKMKDGGNLMIKDKEGRVVKAHANMAQNLKNYLKYMGEHYNWEKE